MLQIGLGFFGTLDGIESSCFAAPQPVDLRKHKPHPMVVFAAPSEFAMCLFMDSLLGRYKSLEAEWILLFIGCFGCHVAFLIENPFLCKLHPEGTG